MRLSLLFALAALMLGCSARPPSNPDQICDILKQHPSWHRALRHTYKKYRVHPAVILAFMHQESSFIHDARPEGNTARRENESSEAWGYSQALAGTWNDYVKMTGNTGAHRENFADSVDFIGWYIDLSHIELNIPLNDARNLYLSFHEGRGGYERGSHRTSEKTWLRIVAAKVGKRARMYTRQYKNCPLRSDRQRRVQPAR